MVTSPFAAGVGKGQPALNSTSAIGHSQKQPQSDLMEAKLQLLVEAPAAVEDALASLLSHADLEVQVCSTAPEEQQHVWHVQSAVPAVSWFEHT